MKGTRSNLQRVGMLLGSLTIVVAVLVWVLRPISASASDAIATYLRTPVAATTAVVCFAAAAQLLASKLKNR